MKVLHAKNERQNSFFNLCIYLLSVLEALIGDQPFGTIFIEVGQHHTHHKG